MSRNLSFIFRAKVSTFWLMASLSLAVTIISPARYFPTVDIDKRNLVSAYLQATMYTKCTNSILSPAKNNNCTIFQLSEYQCVQYGDRLCLALDNNIIYVQHYPRIKKEETNHKIWTTCTAMHVFVIACMAHNPPKHLLFAKKSQLSL